MSADQWTSKGGRGGGGVCVCECGLVRVDKLGWPYDDGGAHEEPGAFTSLLAS